MKKTFRVTGSAGADPRTDRKGTLDACDVQISVTANIPRGMKLAREVIVEAIRYRAAHGENPKGFTVKLIRWRNPSRSGSDSPNTIYKNAEDAELQPGWREYGSQDERFGTLARLLRGRRMVYKVAGNRKSGRKVRRKKPANRHR